ncbi:methyltransferase family protein [Novipirellula herctigrandis]|uniref:methyltransferase family protein n=1 Tax=Novipirellula herctigrandis TaxID=2527986 RepID=UPI003AF40AA8
MRQTVLANSLVVAQFIVSAVIVLSANWQPFDWLPLVLTLPGIGIAVWAWQTIGLLNVRIHPTPTEQTKLTTTGPYRFVRHPMYSGVLWMTAALLLSNPQSWRCAAWGGLLSVLYLKAAIEEQAMSERFPSYESLQKRTGMLMPRLVRKASSSNE